MLKKLFLESLSHAVEGKRLLNAISLEYSSGTLQGVIGPNGSGKSTLLKILSGLWKPASGKVTWNGVHFLKLERKLISRIVTLVPQSPAVHFDFSVQDIVAMGNYAYEEKYWQKIDPIRMEEALNSVNAWHLRTRRVDTLSQGERQRIYIARALMSQAPIILLDEPTANADMRHQIDIWVLLEKLALQGKLVIVATHDLAYAQRHCHQITVLNHGKCAAHAQSSIVLTPEILQEVFQVKINRLQDFPHCA